MTLKWRRRLDTNLGAYYSSTIEAPTTDCLTGLFNHGFFQICLDREIKRSLRHGTHFCLAMVNIDSFSNYNRRFGALESDRMLREVSKLISQNIREVDLAARYSGDTYAILFIMSYAEDVRTAAERMRISIEEMSAGKVTVSIGLASYQLGDTRESLIWQAKQACSQAKIRGKNRIHLFEKDDPFVHDEKTTILVVDDEPVNLKVMEAMLVALKYNVLKASSGEEAIHMVQKTDVDLILLDIMMPGMDGYQVCRRLKSNETTRLIPIIMLTALSGTDAKVKGIEAGADDFITKPPNKIELLARTRALVKFKALNNDLIGVEDMIVSLANTIEARDPYTEGHVQRVAQLAVAVGKSLGLRNKGLRALKLGGVLHDIGKIKVPDSILNKTDRLTPEERKIMEAHADAGYRICLPLKKTLGEALDIVRFHHEKMDGSGYPDGLKGGEIPMVARIMAIVDIYDALITDRPYRKGMNRQESLKLMKAMVVDGKLDGDLFKRFSAILDRMGADSYKFSPSMLTDG